ncbi:MAG: mannose-1-phosphate guanylyltransferase [Proteobacteria bacterium]|nr:MAG: mannose-1-phosphate guanylyltransferase [Pseudomonadota bacterium]
MADAHLHAVVMAGGAGERFWPRSRRARPKPLLRVAGGATLLDAALAHARRFAGADRVWLVCTQPCAAALRKASGLPRARVLVEPEGRNTAMAVAFAAAHVAARDPDAVTAFLPADHAIPDGAALQRALRKAARAAARAGALVTLGVAPTRPETGYGYIQVGRAAGPAYPGLHRVRRFVEKPALAVARRLLRSGGHLWNAGIFVWRADAILEEIERCEPALARALAAYRDRPTRASLARAYRGAPSLPIDVAVLERSRRVWTLPVDFPWSDVGSWASLAAELGVDARHSRVVDGAALLLDAPGNLVWPDRRFVALLGVEGLAVIDAGDALLVARLDRSADVRRVVAALRERKRADLL